MTTMTDHEIKVMFSKKILQMEDKSAEMVLRTIMFRSGNLINWQDAYETAVVFMPELKSYVPE